MADQPVGIVYHQVHQESIMDNIVNALVDDPNYAVDSAAWVGGIATVIHDLKTKAEAIVPRLTNKRRS